jgi:outer membrane immunogenic protein
MKNTIAPATALLLAIAAAPAAAEDFRGFYFGVHGGSSTQTDDAGEFLRFDTDLDGDFDDPVNTPTNGNIFAPGFCGGGPNTGRPQAGCRNNFDDKAGDTGVRLGYDWQTMDLVYGIVVEHASGGVTDNVTGFTTDLNTYTFNRELGSISSLRGRVGFTFGDGTTVVYGTAGYAWATVENTFASSNTANTYVASDPETDANGVQLGVGVETFVWKNFTVGLEYIHSSLESDPFTVRAQGPAPADNPFVIDNPLGTDIQRSSRDIDVSSTRLTFNARFPGW